MYNARYTILHNSYYICIAPHESKYCQHIYLGSCMWLRMRRMIYSITQHKQLYTYTCNIFAYIHMYCSAQSCTYKHTYFIYMYIVETPRTARAPRDGGRHRRGHAPGYGTAGDPGARARTPPPFRRSGDAFRFVCVWGVQTGGDRSRASATHMACVRTPPTRRHTGCRPCSAP